MAEQSVRVEREDGADGGRYLIRLPDGLEAEMTFRKLGKDVIAIDHTGVPTEHRGQGLAEKLVKQAMDDARASGTKIVPLCSYVAAQFRRHPEWSDLQARDAQ